MLRRLRSEVLPDLPAVVENIYRVDMTKNQKKIYRIIKDELMEALSDEEANMHFVEAKFMMLRMVCDTPEVFLQSDARSVKQFVKYIVKEETGKMKELRRLLEEDLEGKRTVIFTEWKRVLDILDDSIIRPKAYIHGGLSAKERKNQINKFRSVDDCVMLSTDAGSTGLDGLQVASNVINFELPFSVTTLSQRVGRLHRAGQKDSVNAIHLICRGTVEGSVLSKLRIKKNLFNQVIEGKSLDVAYGKEQYKKLLLEA